MKGTRAAIIGAGFMGRTHLEALVRLGSVEVAAVVARRDEAARALAQAFGVPRWETDPGKVFEDPDIGVVHLCTPNQSHAPLGLAAMEASKHVLCEKPLATSSEEGGKLVAMAAEKGLRNCTCHNLRYYPMVQQMRRMREAGELGEILVVQGTYSQDWLLHDTDWNWRIDPVQSGPSRAMADIGSHWCDMAEHVTGQRITSLSADLQTFHSTRKRPTGSVETFAGKMEAAAETVEERIVTEDFGAVVLRMGDRTRGSFTASQVSAGRKNHLNIEIYGTAGAVAWDQERPNQLWIGRRDGPNELIVKDPALMKEAARSYSDYPGGHAEGYPDTFKQVFRRFYRSVESAEAEAEYPQFSDGLRQLRILDAVLASHRSRAWVEVSGS